MLRRTSIILALVIGIVLAGCTQKRMAARQAPAATEATDPTPTPAATSTPPVPSGVNTMAVKNLKVLTVIYRGTPGSDQYMDDATVRMAQKGLEIGRLFYFRNSRARLNVQMDWMIVDSPAPETAGPTMKNIEADVHARGVADGEYDGLMVTGVGLKGNFGGFTVLGGAGGCFGTGSPYGVPYPGFDEDVGYGWAWIFAHEFQHALDLVIVAGSDLQMLHSHPYVDRTEDSFKGYYLGGEHWDWIAVTLEEFDDYLRIKGMREEILTCVDADDDGLPDDDQRLPADERRFGSDPTVKDTDGDGLDDLGEFTANRYFGSDPTFVDSDEDGLSDAVDPYPLVSIEPELPYFLPGTETQLGPVIHDPVLRSDTGGEVKVAGGWNEDGLFFDFTAPRKFTVHAKIDGSAANGFWEGGDTYVLKMAPEQVEFAGLGLRGPVPDAECKVLTLPGKWQMTVFVPAALGQGVSKEINYGGARDASDVVDGLTLVPGRSIGLNFVIAFEDGTKALLTPYHTMYGIRLTKPAGLPDKPILWGPDETSAAVPVVNVEGVDALSRVMVVDVRRDRVVGVRVGPGAVQLVGLDADGTYELEARVGDQRSRRSSVIVDRTALPPDVSLMQPAFVQGDRVENRRQLVAACEPGASLQLWWGVQGVPVAPLTGAQADDKGRVELVLDQGLRRGWVATGFLGSNFEHPLFVEGWDVIDRHFKGGAPDPRLPGDGFSYRFVGWLKLNQPGAYTFELNTDDGSRLFINDEIVINHWGQHGMEPLAERIQLPAGMHRIRIDYQERDGWAGVKFRFAPPDGDLRLEAPVLRTPVPLQEVELFGIQTDRFGNRSAFSQPVTLAE